MNKWKNMYLSAKYLIFCFKIRRQDRHRLLGSLRDRRQQHLGQERVCSESDQQSENIIARDDRTIQNSKKHSFYFGHELK